MRRGARVVPLVAFFLRPKCKYINVCIFVYLYLCIYLFICNFCISSMHNQELSVDTPRHALGLGKCRFVVTLNLNVPNVLYCGGSLKKNIWKKINETETETETDLQLTLSWQYVLLLAFRSCYVELAASSKQ